VTCAACQCSKQEHEWEGRTCVQPAASGVPASALAATERDVSASASQATTLAWRQQDAERKQAASCFHLASAGCRAVCSTCHFVSALAGEEVLLQMGLVQRLLLLNSQVCRQLPPAWADPRYDSDAVLQTLQAQSLIARQHPLAVRRCIWQAGWAGLESPEPPSSVHLHMQA
jgi:hypothetical protein